VTGAGRRLTLVGPAILVIGALLVGPLVLMAYVSTLERGEDGGVLWHLHTADAYVQFLYERDLFDQLVLNTDYIRIFLRSITIAAVTALVTLVLALPTALWMAFQPENRRPLLVLVVTVPFWTNLLVRNYAWVLMLRDGGLVDWALRRAGLTSAPIDVLYTPVATSIGLVYSFLPFMILPIYVSMERIDRRYIEAAYDLGAGRWRAIRRVILPLAMPGIVGGLILVFVPCLGAFVSPELLGGAKSMMLGSLIQQQFGQARNWPFGAALAFVLLSLILGALWLHAACFRRGERVRP
jgi:spermidine/putrescine transport system permease protein